MLKVNYHTHLYLCKHATGDFEDYIKRAISLGYTELGFSDHAPLIKEINDKIYTRRMTIDEYKDIYVPTLRNLKQKYEGIIKLYSSCEIEYFDVMKDIYPRLLKEHDYLVLGQHYIQYDNNYISTYSQLSIEKVEAYSHDVITALNTGYFKILAHPDLFCWGYPIWDDICIEVSNKIIDAAIKNNVYLEINANGIRNCEDKHRFIVIPNGDNSNYHCYAYPNLEFFKLAKAKGAKIILNDDCHNPENLYDERTKQAEKFAEELGIKLETSIDFTK